MVVIPSFLLLLPTAAVVVVVDLLGQRLKRVGRVVVLEAVLALVVPVPV